MRIYGVTGSFLGAALALAFCAATVHADVTCKDGTTSTKTGRGACSHHGGVANAAAAPAGSAAAPDAGSGGVAAPPPGAVTCKDGSQSKPGRGACSHHGGIAAAGAASAPAPVNERAPSKTGAAASRGGGDSGGKSNDATGATAECKDGTYSHSQHHTGTCSRHGGVAKWLDGSGK